MLARYSSTNPSISRIFEKFRNSIQDEPFQGISRIGYHKMMKIGTLPKKDPKIYQSWTHPLGSADISIPSPNMSKFLYIKKHRYRLDFRT